MRLLNILYLSARVIVAFVRCVWKYVPMCWPKAFRHQPEKPKKENPLVTYVEL